MALSLLKKGVPIDRQSKEIIQNLYEYCVKEKESFMLNQEEGGEFCIVSPLRVTHLVAAMTGVSISTVERVIKETREGECTHQRGAELGRASQTK